MATAAGLKVVCWRQWGWSGLRLGGFPRSLSAANSQVPPKGVEVPEISLPVEADKSRLPSPSPPPTPVSYYLDTHSVVLQLQGTGFSEKQAEAVVRVLTQAMQNMPTEKSIVSLQHLELSEVKMLKEVEKVASKQILLEKTTLDSLRREHEVLKDRVEKLMNSFKEEVTKVQSNLQLDLNLEKGRIKEDASGLRQEVKDTNNRIDMALSFHVSASPHNGNVIDQLKTLDATKVAQITTQIESQKLESIKYLAGVILSVVTVLASISLGIWRLMK